LKAKNCPDNPAYRPVRYFFFFGSSARLLAYR